MDDWSKFVSILREMVPAVATLLAAFFGAFFAYRLHDNAKKRELRSLNLNAANSALFALFKQLNCLVLFQRDMIDPHRKNPYIFIVMQPYPPENQEDYQFDFQSLEFLLSSKYKLLVLDLFIEQQRFKEAIKAINGRSDLHIQRIQPALSAAGIQEGVGYRDQDIKNALGQLLYLTLKRATEHVINHVDRTVVSLDEAKTKMLQAFNELFPEGELLNFELLEEPVSHPVGKEK